MPADSEIAPASKAARVSALLERAFLISGGANAFLPGIAIAAAAGVQLAQAIQIAEKNKEDFIGLGESCTEILEALSRVPVDRENKTECTKLEADANRLGEVVRSVEKIVTKRGKKSWYLKRLWNHLTYKRIIEKCQNRIEFALKMFNLQGIVELRQKVAEIHAASAPWAGERQVRQQSDGGQRHRMRMVNDGTVAGFAAPGGNLEAERIEVKRARPGEGQAHEPSSDQRPAHVPHSASEPLPKHTRPAPTQYASDPEPYTGNFDFDLINKGGGIIAGFAGPGGRVNVGEVIVN